MFQYWLAAMLMIAGILILLDIRLLQALPRPERIKTLLTRAAAYLRSKRRVPLKTKVYRILGKKKDNIFVKTKGEALLTLEKTGERGRGKRMERSCYLFAAAGVCVGLLLKNPYMVPALGVGLYFIPLWVIKLSYNSYISHVNDELDVALSQVTSSYISSNNLVSAVRENLRYINSPVHEVFSGFVATVENIDPNIERGILQMQKAFDSYIFVEWCNALIQCQRDSTLKSTLHPHVAKFSRQKYMQEKQRTGQMIPFQEFAGMCLLTPGAILMMYFFSPEWFGGLLSHPVGQITLAATAIVMIVGLNKAIGIAAPFQLKR